MLIIRVILFLLLMQSPTWAAIYYIDDAGSNGNAGTSTAAPWLTWAYAFSNTSCGDTLIVMDGTYTTTNGAFSLTKVCTVSTVYTIQAQNERQAYIDKSGGTQIPLYITASAYITVAGLRVRGGDLAPASGGVNTGVCNAYNSSHITFRHMLCSHPNRYRNAGHVYQFYNTHDSLIEENEAHYFHRHGFYIGGGSSRNTIRRNYCNGRDYADLSGAGVENPSTSPQTDGPDDCFIVYPGNDNVFENNIAEGDQLKYYAVEAINPGAARNKFYGNIGLGGAWNGIAIDARGATAATMPTDTDIRHMYIENTTNHGDTTQLASGYRFNGNKTTTCLNCTASNTVDGFAVDRLTAQPGDGVYSATLANSLALNVVSATGTYASTTGYGFRIASVIGTWTATNVNSYNAQNANYNPSTHANYAPLDTPTSTDPQMGTCKLWRPAGSAALTNNWGAEILYRYETGVLTTTKLWDPITGQFPHGAAVSGITDADGVGVHNVHTRLNVNTGGCSFPAGYGSTASINPSNVVATDNTGGAHIHVVNSGMDSLTVAVMVRWDGYLSTPTAEVTAITSSCGTQDIPGIVASWGTPDGDRTMRVFGKISPNSGTCTITPTFSSANVSGWVMISVTEDNVTSYAATSASSGFGAAPASTVTANPTDRILGFVATRSTPTLATGDDQILWTDKVHPTVYIRGALSWQSGASGGVMTHVLGSSVGWIAQNVALSSGGGGSGSTFRVSRYRVDGLLGETATPEVTLGALAAQDTTAYIGLSGAFRIRAEIIVETADSTNTGTSLYCRKNGGTYSRITNAFGSNVVRFYGAGTGSNLPAHDQRTTQRFSGTFAAGYVWRDDNSAMTLDGLPTNTRTEVDYLLVLGNGAVKDDLIEFQIRTDSGATLGTHTVLPTVSAATESAAMGF